MIRPSLLALVWAALLLQPIIGAPARQGSRQPIQTSRCNEVPAHPFDIVLGRPTSNAVTASVLCYADLEGFLAYGTEQGHLSAQTSIRTFKAGQPAEVLLPGLKPNTQYFYQLRFTQVASPEFAFHTARSRESAFTFTVMADSHLDEHTDAATYQRTLANALADSPDIHIDLGDTFMTEKQPTREAAARQYLAQRYYFGQLGHSAPLFLVLGNHDGESPRGRDEGSLSLAVWANLMRKRYFPNPVPDSFFSGNATPHPQAGLLEDYYAWEWGDALFIVLDPFWFSQQARGQTGNWRRTLGAGQYQWLKRTLESSRATFKFIFVHHLVGGLNDQSRGGAEAASHYEWGGRNADGTSGFTEHRPGWPAPIHQLLVSHHVSVVFHGHDHFYAKQDLDGIVYQEVPQPGTPGTGGAPRSAADYGYQNGILLGGSGHLRVQLFRAKVRVEHVRPDGSVAHSYHILPRNRF